MTIPSYSTAGTKTFIRGEIKEGEKFFIVLQEDHYLNNSSWNSIIINYYSVRKDDAIAFTSCKDGGDPLLFTAKIKDGKIKFYVEDEPISKYNICISSNKSQDHNSLYGGMWYSLFYEKDSKQIPWNVLSLDTKEIDVKNNLIGSNINGFFTKREGKVERKLDGTTNFRYTLIPEHYSSFEDGKIKKSFQSFKEWVIRPLSSTKGFSLSENDKEWYDYSFSENNKPQKLKKGRGGWVTSQKKEKNRNLSFSDLEKEERKNAEKRGPTALDKFFSFFTRDNGNNSLLEEQPKFPRDEDIILSNNNDPPPPSGGNSYFGVIVAFIIGCLLTILIVYIVLSITSSSKSKVKTSSF